jgi:hypothetical protein
MPLVSFVKAISRSVADSNVSNLHPLERLLQNSADSLLQLPGKVFQILTQEGPQVFIPPSLMNEVKALPGNVLSISDGIRKASDGSKTIKTILIRL